MYAFSEVWQPNNVPQNGARSRVVDRAWSTLAMMGTAVLPLIILFPLTLAAHADVSGQDIYVGDADGFTPLMNAAGMANSVAIRCLLEEGANAAARNVYGHSALDISERMWAERMHEREAEGHSWEELHPLHLDVELNGFNDCEELLKKAEACEAEGLGWHTCDDARARAAREQSEREKAALEHAAREKKVREQAARDTDEMDDANAVLAFLQTVLAEKTQEQATLKEAVRTRQAKAAREKASWERKDLEKYQLDEAAREQATRQDAATENAAREEKMLTATAAVLAFLQTVLAEKTLEQATLWQAVRQRQAIAVREKAAWERNDLLDQAAREQATRQDALTESAAREEAVRTRVAGEHAVLAKAADMQRWLSFATFC